MKYLIVFIGLGTYLDRLYHIFISITFMGLLALISTLPPTPLSEKPLLQGTSDLYWQQTNLSVGDVTALAIDPTNTSTVYATWQYGGVYKTTTDGDSWSRSSLFIDYRALVIDPTNSNIVYVGEYDRIHKTVNGGTSWVELNLGYGGWALTIDPKSPLTVYAGNGFSSGTIKNSTDGGVNWQTLTTKVGDVLALTINPTATNVIYAGTKTTTYYNGTAYVPVGGGIYRSSNSGLNWTRVLTNNQVNTLAIDPANPLIVYAGTEGTGILKSVDGGTIWTDTNAGLTSNIVRALVIDPKNTSIVYAGTWEGGVFRSDDNGASWTSINTGLLNTYILSLAIDPKNTNILYAGTKGDGVFRSDSSSNPSRTPTSTPTSMPTPTSTPTPTPKPPSYTITSTSDPLQLTFGLDSLLDKAPSGLASVTCDVGPCAWAWSSYLSGDIPGNGAATVVEWNEYFYLGHTPSLSLELYHGGSTKTLATLPSTEQQWPEIVASAGDILTARITMSGSGTLKLFHCDAQDCTPSHIKIATHGQLVSTPTPTATSTPTTTPTSTPTLKPPNYTITSTSDPLQLTFGLDALLDKAPSGLTSVTCDIGPCTWEWSSYLSGDVPGNGGSTIFHWGSYFNLGHSPSITLELRHSGQTTVLAGWSSTDSEGPEVIASAGDILTVRITMGGSGTLNLFHCNGAGDDCTPMYFSLSTRRQLLYLPLISSSR